MLRADFDQKGQELASLEKTAKNLDSEAIQLDKQIEQNKIQIAITRGDILKGQDEMEEINKKSAEMDK